MSDISGVSDTVNYVIIQLSDISSLSDIVNYANIQIFDISCMSDVLKHLIIYSSDVFGVSDIVNYSIIQLSDISCMSDVLSHLNIVCPLNIQSGLAWPVQTAHEYPIWISLTFTDCPLNSHWILDQSMKGKCPGWFLCYYTLLKLLSMLIISLST